ncbi:MAG: hypothetical protein ACKO3S_09995, partial [bacterium]
MHEYAYHLRGARASAVRACDTVASAGPLPHTPRLMSLSLPLQPSTPNFFGMSRDRFRRHVQGLGVPAFRAEQVYSWVYQKHVRD